MMDIEDVFLPLIGAISFIALFTMFGFIGASLKSNNIEDQCEKFSAFYIGDTRYTCEAVN